jgi:hypothetical protein
MGRQRLPAIPADIATFIGQTGLSVSMLQEEMAAIDDAHFELGYAEPCKGRVVSDALHKLHSQPPPRSWAKEEWPVFRALPWAVQKAIVKREEQRDKALNRAHNEAAELRKKFEQIEKTNADQKTTATAA